MYMGEHTNVTEKLHEIQKQGRTKGSLLDHIAIPVTAFFVATDLMTVHLYTESLFDERPEMAMLVAASIALLLDACPMVAGKLKGQLDDMLPRDQRATKRRISALLGTAVGAFAIFAGFCIVSTLMSVEALGATENPTLYMVGQYIRMLLPIATSVGSYAIGFFSDHRSQLDSLKAQSLSIAARQARLSARMKLAEELGSVEAAEALLHSAGLDDLLDEQHWQAMLLPPALAEAAPEQPVLRLEAEPAAEKVPAAMAS